MLLKTPLLLCAATSFLAASTYVAFGGKTVNTSVPTPANFKANVYASGCTNNPGPYITLDGEIFLAGIDACLIFRNNEKGTHEHTEDVTVEVSLSSDRVIKFAKQPPLGGVGGNPFIFLELCDENGNSISEPVLLGRCVQGLNPVNIDFNHLAGIFAVIAGSCSNNPGPYITLDGSMEFGGIKAKLIFQNSPHANAPHKRTERVELSIDIVEPGGEIKFAKQPPLGGVGGNPRIYVQFKSHGMAVSPEYYLGRCVQLSK